MCGASGTDLCPPRAGPVLAGRHCCQAVARGILLSLQALPAPLLAGHPLHTYLRNSWVSWPSSAQSAVPILRLSLNYLTPDAHGKLPLVVDVASEERAIVQCCTVEYCL